MKKLIVLLVLLTTSAILLSSCAVKPNDLPSTPTSSTQDQLLIAEGRLEPLNSLEHSFSISGQVAEVLVKNGEVVKAGQTLARLDDSTSAELSLANAKAEALAAQQQFDQLQSTTALTLAQAQLDLATARQDYDKIRWNQVQENQARSTNAEVINAARAAVTIAEDQVEKAEERYNDFSETKDSDPLKAAALSTLANARLNLDKAKLNLNYYLNPPNEYDLAISNAEVAVAKARFEEAQRLLEKLQNGSDSDELAMARARLESANAAVLSAQHQIDSLTLKAAIDGSIVDLNLQVGQKVAAGETAVVVADFSNWLVKTDNLTETDVTSITLGQSINLMLDALPEKKFEGEVTYINSLFEEKRGDITYTVTIMLTQTDPLMRWGMTGALEFLQ